jgi:ceramide glucosyltransferase
MIAFSLAGSYLAILALKRALALRYARLHRAPPVRETLPMAPVVVGGAAPVQPATSSEQPAETIVQPAATAEAPAEVIVQPAAIAEPLAVTIVQPILSGDPLLESTLARNVELLGGARFVWLVDDDDPTARTACTAIVRRNPARDISILTCPSAPANANPKLFKLELARATVTTGAFVVVDDDTVVGPQALGALLTALESHALATGLPSYEMGGNVPSQLVAQFVNDNSALTYLAICALMPPPTVNGMCYALTCATLDEIGGFAPLLRSLTDDLAIARAVLGAGGTVFQSPYPHEIRTTVPGWRAYVRLMHRWFVFARLLLASERQAVTALVGGLYVVPPLLLWSSGVLALVRPSPSSIGACAVLLAARGALLIDVQRRTLGRARHDWPLSVLSELLQPLHALHALCNSTIRWRSRRIRVRDIDDFSLVS